MSGRPRVRLHPERLRQTPAGPLVVRFAVAVVVEVAAALLSRAAGPRLGGVMLAFPVILVASLTLIGNEEDRGKARDDARGAAIGTLGLLAFAVAGVVLLPRVAPAGALAGAAGAWVVVALAAYNVVRLLGAGDDETAEGHRE